VTLDGQPVADAQGTDTDADGTGTVPTQTTYQLVRQSGAISDRTMGVEFLDGGVEAYCFTFG